MGFAALKAFLQGEVSGQALQAYRRAGLQVLDLETALHESHAPEGRAKRYARLFHWTASGLMAIAGHLLDADEEADPATRDYLPRVSFDQAKALYVQVPDSLSRGFAALADPEYSPECPLPLELAPCLRGEGELPEAHLRGLLRASESLEARARLLLDAEAGEASAGLRALHAAARSRQQWTAAKAAEVLLAPPEETAHAEALSYLWDTLSDLFLLGQYAAVPFLAPSSEENGPPRARGRGAIVPRRGKERWRLSDPTARRALQETADGERDIDRFWQGRGWEVTDAEAQTLAQIRWLLEKNRIVAVTPWSVAPYDTVYRTREPVHLLGRRIPRDHDFRFDLSAVGGRLQIGYPRFTPAKKYGGDPKSAGPLLL